MTKLTISEAKSPHPNSSSVALPRNLFIWLSNLVSSFVATLAILLCSQRLKRACVASFVFALLLIFLSSVRSWAGVGEVNGFASETPAAVPTLVQHVATGMDRYPINTLTIQLPNPARAG